MFQIHHLQQQWGAIQQCRALEGTYREVLKDSQIKKIADPKAATKAAAIALAEQTGIDERTAFDRVKFLRWPKKIKDRLYESPDQEGYWYICEIEEKIILPALVNYPEYFDKVSVDEVRGCLFKKLARLLLDRRTFEKSPRTSALNSKRRLTRRKYARFLLTSLINKT